MILVLAWLRAHRKVLLIGAPIAALAMWFAFCIPKPNTIPERERFSLDSLKATEAAFIAHHDTLILRETTFVRTSAQEARRATIATHAADSLRTIANALQAKAEAAGDTLSEWRAVALAREVETDTLRSALSATTRALTMQISAREAADERATATEQRLNAVNDLARRLADDVKTAGQCRVLFVARCPSRKTVAIAGALVGAGVIYLAQSHRE